MLFSSHIFILLFLPVTLLLYYGVGKSAKHRIWLLIFASLVFYGYWDIRFIPFLVGSVCINWLLSHYYDKVPMRGLILLGVGFNLGAIAFFKYFNFFMTSAVSGFQAWEIILPLGISFFTFQQISYLVDLHRKDAQKYDFAHYFLYVVFFPQLIAGPIVRHNELIPQLDQSPARKGMYERLSRGGVLFILGLGKKVLIADQMINASDTLFASALVGTLTFAEGWVAALAYSLQLYFDFSSYSDMAIGLGLMFGFMLPINFNAPYKATSIRDFWRRWHMTLTRLLTDYVYIPLGGNRFGFLKQINAIMVTMLLCGLWHGAGWTFVAWGGFHGIALVVNNYWVKRSLPMPKLLGWLITMLFVICGWVLFRAENFSSALGIISAMSGLEGMSFDVQSVKRLWLIPVAIGVAIFGPTNVECSLEKLKPNKILSIIFAILLAYIVLEVGKGQVNEFIYFQF